MVGFQWLIEVHQDKYLQDNRGEVSRGQVDVSVKCLRVVLVYRLFYKTKPN